MTAFPDARPAAHDAAQCGHCEGCRWWQDDPADGHRLGLCLHDEIAHFQLEVSADSGCNRFAPATTAGWAMAAEMGAGD